MTSTIKVPLVSYTVSDNQVATPGTPRTRKVSFFCDEICLMDMEIDASYLENANPLFMVQLFVTPHEHMALLQEWLSAATNHKEGNFDSLISRTESILFHPK